MACPLNSRGCARFDTSPRADTGKVRSAPLSAPLYARDVIDSDDLFKVADVPVHRGFGVVRPNLDTRIALIAAGRDGSPIRLS